MRDKWTIEIQRTGLWPFRWEWYVHYCNNDLDNWESYMRSGSTFSKDRAQRAAAKAKLDIERNDITMYV